MATTAPPALTRPPRRNRRLATGAHTGFVSAGGASLDAMEAGMLAALASLMNWHRRRYRRAAWRRRAALSPA
jgi:hypothetical protein